MDQSRKQQIIQSAHQLGRDGQSESVLQRLVFDELEYEEIEEASEAIQAAFHAGWADRKARLWSIRYTTASRDYDGFGTTELDPCVATTCNKALRKVAIHPDHVQWQTLRYQSGCCTVVDQAEFDKLASFGLIQLATSTIAPT